MVYGIYIYIEAPLGSTKRLHQGLGRLARLSDGSQDTWRRRRPGSAAPGDPSGNPGQAVATTVDLPSGYD